MSRRCPDCGAQIKAEQQGMFCSVCGYYEPPKSHEKLRDDLNERYLEAQNQIRMHLRRKLENKDAHTKQ